MITENPIDATGWYLIHTNPRQEDRAEFNLRAWGVETFTPRLMVSRFNQFTEQTCPLIKSLFPSYIFARFNIEKMFHKVRFTRGVRGVISFGAGPAQVDDEVINIVRSRVEGDGFVRIRQDFEPGDEIRVKEGPLRDFIGIFEREMNCNDRVMILLKTINYQAHFEIEASLIEKAIKH